MSDTYRISAAFTDAKILSSRLVCVLSQVGGALGEELHELQGACLSLRRSNQVSAHSLLLKTNTLPHASHSSSQAVLLMTAYSHESHIW